MTVRGPQRDKLTGNMKGAWQHRQLLDTGEWVGYSLTGVYQPKEEC